MIHTPKPRQTTKQALNSMLSLLADAGALLDGIKGESAEEILAYYTTTKDEARHFAGYVQQKNLVNVERTSARSVKLFLTLAGWRRVQRHRIRNMTIPRPERWDGRWRLVMFDIPERFKVGRNAVTIELKRLGMFQLQRSVWVYPFDCQDQIGMLSQLYGVDQFMVYMVVDFTNADAELRSHFSGFISARG
jgi:hypothetical protein